MTSYTRRPLPADTAGLLRGEKSRFEGEWVMSQDVSRRCPLRECDRPLHTGLHEDADGFRWQQDVP